jgi:hypothetical protein
VASSGYYATTPGAKYDQELNDQVLSRKWYPRPKPAVGSTISIVNGLHAANGGTLQSGAITVDAATRYIQTMVMSDSDEYEAKTEATQLFSDGARSFVFEAWTREMQAGDNDAFPYVFPFTLE